MVSVAKPSPQYLDDIRRAFTAREVRAVQLMSQGLSNREIADRIGTTEQVIKNYLRHAYRYFNCSRRVQLALMVARDPDFFVGHTAICRS